MESGILEHISEVVYILSSPDINPHYRLPKLFNT